MTRTGRPKADNPKDCDVKVRFDSQKHQKLLDYCKKHGISKAEAIRNGVDLLLGEKNREQTLLWRVHLFSATNRERLINLLYQFFAANERKN